MGVKIEWRASNCTWASAARGHGGGGAERAGLCVPAEARDPFPGPGGGRSPRVVSCSGRQ